MKKILINTGVFAAAITVLWLSLLLTSLIPNEAIFDNLYSSALSYDGAEPFVQKNSRKSTIDNYADVILLNVMWNMHSDEPIVSTLDTRYYDGNDGVTDYGENYGLYAAVNGTPANMDYSRYWHGASVFIRPLLLITDVSGIKIIGLCTALILLAVNIFILIRIKQKFAAAALAVSFFAVDIWNIRLSLEYQPVIIICLTLLPFFIILEKHGDSALLPLSVICGTMTAFFDFLTTETLSILIPLIMIMIIRKNENRFQGFRTEMINTVKYGAVWLASYGCTFLIKWTAATIVSGENKFTQALSSVKERVYGDTDISSAAAFFLAPLTNISTLFGGDDHPDIPVLIAGIIITSTLALGFYFIFRKKKNMDDGAALILLLGILPYCRYFVLSNHSYLHDFFTYRAQAAAVLAVLGALWLYSFGYNPPKKTKKHTK